jgi:hypothetical protein
MTSRSRASGQDSKILAMDECCDAVFISKIFGGTSVPPVLAQAKAWGYLFLVPKLHLGTRKISAIYSSSDAE